MGEAATVEKQVEKIRKFSALPICVGFGVKTAEQARTVAAFSDGVVVGSHFVSQIAGNIGDADGMLASLHKAATGMHAAMAQDKP